MLPNSYLCIKGARCHVMWVLSTHVRKVSVVCKSSFLQTFFYQTIHGFVQQSRKRYLVCSSLCYYFCILNNFFQDMVDSQYSRNWPLQGASVCSKTQDTSQTRLDSRVLPSTTTTCLPRLQQGHTPHEFWQW